MDGNTGRYLKKLGGYSAFCVLDLEGFIEKKGSSNSQPRCVFVRWVSNRYHAREVRYLRLPDYLADQAIGSIDEGSE
jgi:hypothetical protein